jgi:hypothetical protein
MIAKAVVISSLGLLVASHALGAAPQITDYNQGRYDQNGQSFADVGPIANYIVGTQVGIPDPSQSYVGFSDNFANFFSFSLSGIAPGSIVAASVEIAGGQNVFDSGPNGVFSLYASPVDPAADESGFLSGLTTANLIGTVSVTDGGSLGFSNPIPSDVTVTFNAKGVADLNAAAGKQFYIGGTFGGADPYVLHPGPGGLTFANLFNGSGNVAGADLSLTTVPEPSTWAMLLAGFIALGAAGYGARRQRASIVD